MGSFSIIPQTIVALEDINNVNVTPTGGQVLFYDATAAQWKQKPSLPVGSTTGWHKTPPFAMLSSGVADTDVLNKLVDTTANFIADGIQAGMIIVDITSGLMGIVSAVENLTTILIRADTQAGSVITDIFPLGIENYAIFATPELTNDWYEMNGQAITDVDSPYNGKNVADLNGSNLFSRSSDSSGTVGGVATVGNHTHFIGSGNTTSAGGPVQVWEDPNTNAAGGHDNQPPYYDEVRIIKVK